MTLSNRRTTRTTTDRTEEQTKFYSMTLLAVGTVLAATTLTSSTIPITPVEGFSPRLSYFGLRRDHIIIEPYQPYQKQQQAEEERNKKKESLLGYKSSQLHVSSVLIIDNNDDGDDDNEEKYNNNEDEEEEDDDDDDIDDDPYVELASSEFLDKESVSALATVTADDGTPTTRMDWGGALGKLRKRVEDVESGDSQNPSQVLFRMMSSDTPNQAIGKFVQSANPQVVSAMSEAVSALLGGLSNPSIGMEVLVKASGEKIGSLCFQLQMTGYMFRNAEYVLALKELMRLRPSGNSYQDYKDAFDRLDKDNSGYIDASEVKDLLDEVVYDGKTPNYEVEAFLQFFDANKDGKISWTEFENGLLGGADKAVEAIKNNNAKQQQGGSNENLLQATQQQQHSDDEEEDDDIISIDPDISGTIEIELEDGKVVEVEAKEFMEDLKKEAQALKEALRREKRGGPGGNGGDDPLQSNNNSVSFMGPSSSSSSSSDGQQQQMDDFGDSIAGYIASRQGDVKALTEGISPEVVETMKKLVDFVLEGGDNRKNTSATSSSSTTTTGGNGGILSDEEKASMEMEIPASALQQLALWQLVLGYRLREAEVTGDFMRLME